MTVWSRFLKISNIWKALKISTISRFRLVLSFYHQNHFIIKRFWPKAGQRSKILNLVPKNFLCHKKLGGSSLSLSLSISWSFPWLIEDRHRQPYICKELLLNRRQKSVVIDDVNMKCKFQLQQRFRSYLPESADYWDKIKPWRSWFDKDQLMRSTKR